MGGVAATITEMHGVVCARKFAALVVLGAFECVSDEHTMVCMASMGEEPSGRLVIAVSCWAREVCVLHAHLQSDITRAACADHANVIASCIDRSYCNHRSAELLAWDVPVNMLDRAIKDNRVPDHVLVLSGARPNRVSVVPKLAI